MLAVVLWCYKYLLLHALNITKDWNKSFLSRGIFMRTGSSESSSACFSPFCPDAWVVPRLLCFHTTNSSGPLSNEQHGEMLEVPHEGADSAGGNQSSVITLVRTQLYQAAQIQQSGEWASPSCPAQGKMHPVISTGPRYPKLFDFNSLKGWLQPPLSCVICQAFSMPRWVKILNL